jgi:hypothetical protein
MKNEGIIVLMLVIFLGLNVAAQVESINNLPNVSKGFLMLTDGKKIEFTRLNSLDGKLVFYEKSGQQSELSAQEVYKVVKVGSWAVEGAVSSGLGGFLGALLGTQGWDGTSLEDKKSGFIIGATIGCVAFGGIIGLLVKKEKVLYKNKNIDFGFVCPVIPVNGHRIQTVGLAFKF